MRFIQYLTHKYSEIQKVLRIYLRKLSTPIISIRQTISYLINTPAKLNSTGSIAAAKVEKLSTLNLERVSNLGKVVKMGGKQVRFSLL